MGKRRRETTLVSQPQTVESRFSDNHRGPGAPSVVVFDVNETLIDVESMTPLFEQIFGDPQVMREWLGHLFTYSMTATLSGLYVDFFALGQGLLQMVGDIHDVPTTPEDIEAVKNSMRTMPAHADVEEGLTILRDNGFRLVTLTNSPFDPTGESPLERAGLGPFFERQFSIDALRVYKPARPTYLYVCEELGVEPAECMMVAAHVWDTVGAQSAGFSAALITRPGNAPLPIHGLPQPTVVASDLCDLAGQLATHRP
jgi:2-haloacid dehalogenase